MLTSTFADEETARPDIGPAGCSLPMTARTVGRIVVAGHEMCVADARNFVGDVLGKDHPCHDVAQLLTSELVTNAVQHSESRRPGGRVTVTVMEIAGGVRVDVSDEGSSSVPVVRAAGFDTCGRGLILVESLCEDWGYVHETLSTTVWFRLG